MKLEIKSGKVIGVFNDNFVKEGLIPAPLDFDIEKIEDYIFDGVNLIIDQKAVRQNEVANITVTTTAGNTFDGNEDAQNRMSRAVTAMSDTDTITWVLADNTVSTVSRGELREALRLAGEAMSSIWVRPYV